MFWRYSLYETKLLLHNRKNWFIAAFLLLFFLVFFIYYSQDEPMTLREQKRIESEETFAAFEYIDEQREDVPEIAEVYNILTKQSELVQLQVYYIGMGNDSEQYIESGLQLNELKLKIHELGNKGLPDHFITPKEEILKDTALLNYIKDNELPLEEDSFKTNYYVENALEAMSGILFLVILLISGSELLVYEQRHASVVKGLPISFLKKITSKVAIYSIQINVFLLGGFMIGILYAAMKLLAGDFSFPVLIYENGEYISVSTTKYLLYIFTGFAVVSLLIMFLSILLNMLFKNAYANILVGLGIFAIPQVMMAAGIKSIMIEPLLFIDIVGVLSGDIAITLGNNAVDFSYAVLMLLLLIAIVIGSIYIIHMLSYRKKPKDEPIAKAY